MEVSNIPGPARFLPPAGTGIVIYRFLKKRTEYDNGTEKRRLPKFCSTCDADLGLSSAHLYPPDFPFRGGNGGTLSFSLAKEGTMVPHQHTSCLPFFENINSWGISSKRTKMCCTSCGKYLGVWRADGPAVDGSTGQLGFGPSQVAEKHPRFQILVTAVRPTPLEQHNDFGHSLAKVA